MRVLVKGGRVLDPEPGLDDFREVLIEDGRIVDLVRPGGEGDFGAAAEIINVNGLLVTPGLIDLHVHLREPGEEYKETIASGTLAAAAGGFTAVACMPNTKPVADERSVIEFILRTADRAGSARVWPVAAMTKGRLGEELCEYWDLAEAGAVGVSDDGCWVPDSRLMRHILEYARLFNLLPISHAEDSSLSGNGVMNEGPVSTRLGLRGLPSAAEDTAVFRDLRLAQLTGCPVHIAHVSTKGAVEIIRQAKASGVPVTAETAPHYFTLTEAAVAGYRTEAKMNPPLRSAQDVAAIKEGLADGTIDAVATDHAPHSMMEKDVEFDLAANGIVGLETALALTLELVNQKVLSLRRVVELLSQAPARILGLPGGNLKPGQEADLTVIDLNRRWRVEPSEFKSKGRNTPFTGLNLVGRAVLTMLRGRPTYNILP
ncbi:MAG: dihydroorotase [Pseudomonadota bacterium]